MDYSSYDHNQYQQQQQQQQQTYDPSQIQAAYDHSSQSYYSYTPQYDPNYSYYPPPQDYTTNSYAQQSQSQFHPEPTTSIHPPGVPIPTEQPTHLQNQQNVYYPPQGVVENQPQLNPPPPVAALSQFAGNMGVAQQQVVHTPIGQSPYRGGGRRGGRPFRGGGRGQFGYRNRRPDGSAPPFRGRGRGQGGGRHFPLHGAASATPTTASAPAEGGAALMLPPSAQVPAAPFWPPPRMAWCELCRVDCNTQEILEQHKNGKRHKKNLQINEELQRLNKVITEQQNVQMPNPELKPEVFQLEKVEGKQPPPENLTSEAVTDDNRNEAEQQQNAVENSEVAAEEPERKPKDHFAAQGRGFKRKMRGGRGGKYMRTFEGSRRPVVPPKPKQVIPLICELCSVKCDSQVVFDSHMTGKKHLANLKRFHGHRAVYGEAGLQALYPPNFNATSTHGEVGPQALYPSNSNVPSSSATPLFQQQGVNDPQVLLAQLLMTYVLSQAQAPAMVPTATLAPAPSASELAPVPPAPGTTYETQYQQGSETQGSGDTSEAVMQNASIMEAEGQPQPIKTESEAPASLCTDTTTENGTAEFVKEVSPDPEVAASD